MAIELRWNLRLRDFQLLIIRSEFNPYIFVPETLFMLKNEVQYRFLKVRYLNSYTQSNIVSSPRNKNRNNGEGEGEGERRSDEYQGNSITIHELIFM